MNVEKNKKRLDMKLYDIGSRTEKGDYKDFYQLNGDHYKWFETEHCVVLALADGVSICANDAEASQIACEQFIEKSREYLSSHSALDEGVIRRFCEEIDPLLLDKREMTCFSAVAWVPGENKAVWLNVGDTRIYTYNFQTGFKQISQDDHGEARIKKENGKLKTLNGAVMAGIPISSAIGDGAKKIHTGVLELLPDESLVLCSDGMYYSPNFNGNMEIALGSVKLNDAIGKFSFTSEDDATILVLRRTDGYAQKWTAQELVDEIESQSPTIPRNVLLHRVGEAIQDVLDQDSQIEDLTKLVKLCDAHRLFIAPEQVSDILEKVVKHYYSLPTDSPYRPVLEKFILALQSYASDTRRFE